MNKFSFTQVTLGVLAMFALPLFVSAHSATLSTATSLPGSTLQASIIANLTEGHYVEGIRWGFAADQLTCKDVEDFDTTFEPKHPHDRPDRITTPPFVFDITAPLAAGVYAFFYQITGSDNCETETGTLLNNPAALTVEAEPVVVVECDPGFHVEDNVCVADPVEEPEVPETPPTPPTPPTTPAPTTSTEPPAQSGGGGGGGGTVVSGPLSLGFVNTNPQKGLILGTSTEVASVGTSTTCGPLLTSYLREGVQGEHVKTLQTFLNAQLGTALTVDGVFGSSTTQAVKDFQLKHWEEVLSPWKRFGLGEREATGYVYKTTLRKINTLACLTLHIPEPQLP